MVLEEICNADVYHLNAFYLLGISVDTTSKKIRRRQEDLDGFSEMGQKAWNREFDKYLLGNASAPKADKTRTLSDRQHMEHENVLSIILIHQILNIIFFLILFLYLLNHQ